MHPSSRRGPSWRSVALTVSVLLNLFLLALIGGHVWQDSREAARERFPMSKAVARLEARLPSRDAAAFEQSLRDAAPRYAEQAQALRAARRAFNAEITAEDFDPARASQALARWRVAWNRFNDAFQGPLIEALSKISPEARRKLVVEQARRAPRADHSVP